MVGVGLSRLPSSSPAAVVLVMGLVAAMNTIVTENPSRRIEPPSGPPFTVEKIAVVGGGVSGLLAARLLCDFYDVCVYEAADYVGGHANTVDVELQGERFAVDTGFMVFNERTYPKFCQLLSMLSVPSRDGDMSFSVQCERTGLEYQGSSINGLFAQRRNLARPAFWRMLADIGRFNAAARRYLRNAESETRLGDFLDRGRYGRGFREQYLLPMIAAIWSAPPSALLDFPALFILRFFDNHGLLQLVDRPQWKTIRGGSRRYVAALTEPFRERIRTGAAVTSVTRHASHVAIESCAGVERFDAVIMATHADQSLRLLRDADHVEQAVLASFPYQQNEAVLHTDTSLLPSRRAAWASWNYRVARQPERPASVTYDLSRLQRIDSPQPILLTLNPTARIDSGRIHGRFTYHHPVFSLQSIAAQQHFDAINGRRRSYFCGAYRFHGFHEDGVASALEVAAHFGKGLNHCKAACTKAASDIVGSVL